MEVTEAAESTVLAKQRELQECLEEIGLAGDLNGILTVFQWHFHGILTDLPVGGCKGQPCVVCPCFVGPMWSCLLTGSVCVVLQGKGGANATRRRSFLF